jgi:hypothetical protein
MQIILAIFEISMALTTKIIVVWHSTPYSLVDRYRTSSKMLRIYQIA